MNEQNITVVYHTAMPCHDTTHNDTTNYLQTKLENEYLIFIKEISSTSR